MSNILQIVENEQTSEFYPTPKRLIDKMLDGIDFDYMATILEPSAGKGDILRELARKEHASRRSEFDVDCIEIDPNLRQILKYNFSDERKINFDRWKDDEYRTFFEKGIHIVHDDFLTYEPFKQYDLIIMNPPFSNGDKHLLKAIDIQKKGGNIVCLLNAETIRNPYTETRRELVKKLREYGAMIEFIEDAFVSAERKTGVEVALIKIAIERKQEESDIFNHFKRAENVEDFDPETQELEVTDYIKAAVNLFRVETKAGIELIRQYRALKPYMTRTFDKTDSFNQESILRLTDSNDRSYSDVSVNEYLEKTRLKYWKSLLANPKFTSKLTSKLQDEYRERVKALAKYDFSEFNIYTLAAEMSARTKKGIEDEIIAMFDRLTAEHSWYPEMQKNRHYYDGWATNKAHKIGKKVIIPSYGVFCSWDGKPRKYEARKVLEDIERIFNFLSGSSSEVDFWRNLDSYFDQGITKNIPLKWFTATFYKKGTVHLVFSDERLVERFNIYAAQNKNWLPPNYGKTKYKDMTAKEKAVVDSFQGEEAYNDVLAHANYYLAPVTQNNMLMLGGANE